MAIKRPMTVHEITELYPEPSAGEISATRDRWISLNEWQWNIAQSVLGSLLNPDIWENFTADMENAVSELLVESELPVEPASYCRLWHSANQSIPHNSATTLAFNTEVSDTDNFHVTSGDNTRITIPVSGIYRIVANVIYDANTTGLRWVSLYRNAAQWMTCTAYPVVSPYGTGMQVISDAWNLTANDYIQVKALQTSGGNLNVLSLSQISPFFTCVKIAET